MGDKPEIAVVRELYVRFNRRHFEAGLELLSDDVRWQIGPAQPALMGPDAVRRYWHALADGTASLTYEDLGVERPHPGVVETAVLVRAIDGKGARERRARHRFTFAAGGRIERFEVIEGGGEAPSRERRG